MIGSFLLFDLFSTSDIHLSIFFWDAVNIFSTRRGDGDNSKYVSKASPRNSFVMERTIKLSLKNEVCIKMKRSNIQILNVFRIWWFFDFETWSIVTSFRHPHLCPNVITMIKNPRWSFSSSVTLKISVTLVSVIENFERRSESHQCQYFSQKLRYYWKVPRGFM